MQPAECLRRVRPLVRERVPAELREFQWESFSFQSKLWYGNKALHYELANVPSPPPELLERV